MIAEKQSNGLYKVVLDNGEVKTDIPVEAIGALTDSSNAEKESETHNKT